MKKVSLKLKRWHDKRSKKIASNKRVKLKYINRAVIHNKNGTVKIAKNVKMYISPNVFSIINNSEETIDYFNDLFRYVSKKSHSKKDVYIDLSNVETITIDAIMFLIAIINNLKQQYRVNLSFSGNSPRKKEPKMVFDESGFYNYVKRLTIDKLDRKDDNIQIVSGVKCDTALAQRVSDFVHYKSGIEIKKLHFLYVMLIELMNNTNKHAYVENENILNSKWFCYVRYVNKTTVAFSFLDTGVGIPTTVKRNFWEKLKSLGTIQDNILMKSVLDGEFRSQTAKGYRGKGIPKIREYSVNQFIKKLQIITNYANVKVMPNSYEDLQLNKKFMGTLYYWEINLKKIEEGENYIYEKDN